MNALLIDERQLSRFLYSFVFNQNEVLIDFIWARDSLKVLSELTKCTQKEQDKLSFLLVNFFAKYHYNNFFHGDIKPDNLFIDTSRYNFYITSDAGTILYLG